MNNKSESRRLKRAKAQLRQLTQDELLAVKDELFLLLHPEREKSHRTLQALREKNIQRQTRQELEQYYSDVLTQKMAPFHEAFREYCETRSTQTGVLIGYKLRTKAEMIPHLEYLQVELGAKKEALTLKMDALTYRATEAAFFQRAATDIENLHADWQKQISEIINHGDKEVITQIVWDGLGSNRQKMADIIAKLNKTGVKGQRPSGMKEDRRILAERARLIKRENPRMRLHEVHDVLWAEVSAMASNDEEYGAYIEMAYGINERQDNEAKRKYIWRLLDDLKKEDQNNQENHQKLSFGDLST